MKSLAFLFMASILFLFVGLALSGGQPLKVPPRISAQTAAPPTPPPKAKGSANHKVEVAAAPAPAAPEKSDFAEALNTDQLCLASQTIGKLGDTLYPTELRGLLRAFGAPTSLQEMFAEKGPLYGPVEAKKRFSTPFLNLMYALRLSNLVQFAGAGNSAPDESAALAILQELGAADPANGAYPYFQLAILSHKDTPAETMREMAERIAHASYFDSMLTAQLAELEGSRWQSATHYFMLEWFSTYVQRISYHASLDALNGLTSERGGIELRDEIGKLMTHEGLRATRRAQRHGFDSQAYNYGTFYTTDEDDPYVTDLSDRIAGYTWRYAPYVSRDKGDCDRTAFDKYYEEMRGHP